MFWTKVFMWAALLQTIFWASVHILASYLTNNFIKMYKRWRTDYRYCIWLLIQNTVLWKTRWKTIDLIFALTDEEKTNLRSRTISRQNAHRVFGISDRGISFQNMKRTKSVTVYAMHCWHWIWWTTLCHNGLLMVTFIHFANMLAKLLLWVF